MGFQWKHLDNKITTIILTQKYHLKYKMAEKAFIIYPLIGIARKYYLWL
jgi:hypothetical protein